MKLFLKAESYYVARTAWTTHTNPTPIEIRLIEGVDYGDLHDCQKIRVWHIKDSDHSFHSQIEVSVKDIRLTDKI